MRKKTKQFSSKEETEYNGYDDDEDNDNLVSRKEKKQHTLSLISRQMYFSLRGIYLYTIVKSLKSSLNNYARN